MFDPDICLCEGKNLEYCKTCRRYKYHLKNTEDERKTGQCNYNSYFVTPPYNEENKSCEYKWED